MYGPKMIGTFALLAAGIFVACLTLNWHLGSPAGVVSLALAVLGYMVGTSAVNTEIEEARYQQSEARRFEARHEGGLLVIQIRRPPLHAVLSTPCYAAVHVVRYACVPVLVGVVSELVRGADWNRVLAGAVLFTASTSFVVFVIAAALGFPKAFRRTALTVGASHLTVKQRGLLLRRTREIKTEDIERIDFNVFHELAIILKGRAPNLYLPGNGSKSADEQLRALILDALRGRESGSDTRVEHRGKSVAY